MDLSLLPWAEGLLDATALEELVGKYNLLSPALSATQTFERLDEFVSEQREARTKDPLKVAGFLAVMLNVTFLASQSAYPLVDTDFLTGSQGQIKGQRSKPNRLMDEWKLSFRFGTESGGTSRGSVVNMQCYVAFLNRVYGETGGPVDHAAAMVYWLQKIEAFFQNTPIDIAFSPKQTLRSFLKRLIEEVRKREHQVTGVKLMGTVMQHVVGAKLDLVLGEGRIVHHSANQADLQYDRSGDFEIDDTVIHVTTAPMERLIAKCKQNLDDGRRPMIVTLSARTAAADQMAQNEGLEDFIEIVDFEAFIVHNLVELSMASKSFYKVQVEDLIRRYNVLIETHEPVHGIRLAIKGGHAESKDQE